MRNIIPTILAFLLAAVTATAQTQGISARATNGYMVAPMFLSNNVVLLKSSNPYNQTSYANPGAARAAATSGDTIVVYPGTYSVTNLAKDGVNWHFVPGVVLQHSFDSDDPNRQAIFQDNPYTVFNQYGDGTNSMSFKVTGTVIATNLQSAFAAFSGVKTKVDFELPGSEITVSNGATFVGVIPGCVVIQLPDLYTYPANKPAMDTRVNFTASRVSGLIYLSDAAATWDVDLYENCAWWLDRDTTNSIYPSSLFRGREARNCNVVAGGAQATGHANGQAAVFDIPLWYGGDPLSLNTNICHLNMGTVLFRNTRFYQGTNATAGLFWLSTGSTSASIDYTNAGWLVFEGCSVIGKAGNTKQLIGWDNAEAHTNNPRIHLADDLLYVNAVVTGLPTNNGPGAVIEVFGLTNNNSAFMGSHYIPGIITGNGIGITNAFGFNTNISGAGMVSNSMPVVQFNGTLYVPGTLLAGNLASAMNPGTFNAYNVRTDSGTAAGVYQETSVIGLNGNAGPYRVGQTINDVGSGTNVVTRNLGGFATNSVTDFVIGTRYTNGTQRSWISASFYLVSSLTGVASVNLKVEQSFKTNMQAVALGSIAAVIGTNSLSMPVAPGAFYYFTDASSGSGASVSIVANSSSKIEW